MKNVKKVSINIHTPLREVLKVIQDGGMGIALVVNKELQLISTITDGDIRRAILRKVPLDTKIGKLLEKSFFKHKKPIFARVGTPHSEILKIMDEKVIRHVPILDENDRIVELIWVSDLIKDEFHRPISALVMAGGRGQRLRPFTKDVPKPMLPLENRPLMERTISQLRNAGITKVRIATHYKPEVITNHFGTGDVFGVDINYINEDQPLGTAGALGLMDISDGPTLVINGDILTQLDFRALLDFHRYHKAVMTVGVRKCEFEVPYGVIEIKDIVVKNIVEKPIQTFLINAGIYLIEPVAYKYIPKKRIFDMPELVMCLLRKKLKVISFPIQEYWLDVGHPIDYKKAEEDVKNGKI